MEEDNYEEADESTYEVVDTSLAKNRTDSTSYSQTPDRTNTYMIPFQKGQTTPNTKSFTRTDSQKYSDGYLLPTVSKVQ